MSKKLTLAVSSNVHFGCTGILQCQHQPGLYFSSSHSSSSVPNRNGRHNRASIVHQRSCLSVRYEVKSGDSQNVHLNQQNLRKKKKSRILILRSLYISDVERQKWVIRQTGKQCQTSGYIAAGKVSAHKLFESYACQIFFFVTDFKQNKNHLI